nr:17.3 kDa class I heat shock protein-like [Ipomoea batatas]
MSIIPSFFGRRSNVFDPFSLDVWDPFDGFPIGNFRPLSEQFRSTETSSFAQASIDWKETPNAHISGERKREMEEKSDTWHRVERSSGKFVRRFRLPENAKVDQVKASMDDGVLTVTVPKEEEEKKQSDVKSIDISG